MFGQAAAAVTGSIIPQHGLWGLPLILLVLLAWQKDPSHAREIA